MLDQIRDIARKHMQVDSTGHDFYHAERTYNLGMRIAATEKCDELVVAASCYLHDIFRPIEASLGILNWHVSPDAMIELEKILRETGFQEDKPSYSRNPADPRNKMMNGSLHCSTVLPGWETLKI